MSIENEKLAVLREISKTATEAKLALENHNKLFEERTNMMQVQNREMIELLREKNEIEKKKVEAIRIRNEILIEKNEILANLENPNA